MVVSSVTPLMVAATSVHLFGVSLRVRLSSSRMIRNSSLSAVDGSGATPAFSNSTPLWISRVASPPSSRIMFGVWPFGQVSAFSVHHQYSSRVSPFQAKTGTPCGFSGVPFGPTAMAAAAWSWVEKMLQEHQRTSAPRAVRVSMRTAVCTVMCSEPVIRAPASGCDAAYSARIVIRPGISCSASWISLRPNGARERSATLKSPVMSVDMRLLLAEGVGRGQGPGVRHNTAGRDGVRRRQGVRPAAGSARYGCPVARHKPSEDLSPSTGAPPWGAGHRSTAISSDVLALGTNLHRRPRRTARYGRFSASGPGPARAQCAPPGTGPPGVAYGSSPAASFSAL